MPRRSSETIDRKEFQRGPRPGVSLQKLEQKEGAQVRAPRPIKKGWEGLTPKGGERMTVMTWCKKKTEDGPILGVEKTRL